MASVAARRLPGRRAFSLLSSFPFSQRAADRVEFPRVARGLDYDVNWSLAADGLTTRGEAYRNAPVRDLLEFAGPRGAVRVTKQRALEVLDQGAAPAAAGAAFATDTGLPGRALMDVDEYESRLASVSGVFAAARKRVRKEDGGGRGPARYGPARPGPTRRGQAGRADGRESVLLRLPTLGRSLF